MRPKYIKQKKSKTALSQLQSKLKKHSNPIRQSCRIDKRKDLQDTYLALQNELSSIADKLKFFHECITEMLEQIQLLEERVGSLEKTKTAAKLPTNTTNYSDALQSDNSKRLEKLEFQNSEEERKKRTLEATITHPDIDVSHTNLSQHLKGIMQNKLKMEQRLIDANMTVRKTTRQNTVLIRFSHSRFKRFLFRAKKDLRENENPVSEVLFINDNLSNYNFQILMSLKHARKRCVSGSDPIKSVYCFEGRVFVKFNDGDQGRPIKTKAEMDDVLQMLPKPSTSATGSNSNKQSTPPPSGTSSAGSRVAAVASSSNASQ